MSELKLGIFGATLCPAITLFSYSDEILLCLGGPLFNFISIIIAITIFSMPPTTYFILSSLALGILNLLPISGFDGGRVLNALLHIFLSDSTANKISEIISFIVLFFLWCLSVYLILKSAASLSLFIFCISVFIKIFLPTAI